MLNTVYQLKRPRQFEVAFKEMEIDDRQVIVRPTRLSICHADQRYYQGARAEEILRQKLPMALIHEGIGKVIYDPTGTFEIGTEVVMIPNRPVEKDDIIAENYLRSSKFCASSMDGFLQEYVQAVPDRFVRLPQGINPTVAAYTELVSVSFHAINRFLRFSHERRDVIGVWGDGNLGYITSLLLKKMLPDSKSIFSVSRKTNCRILLLQTVPTVSMKFRQICRSIMRLNALEAERHPKRSIRSLIISIRRVRSVF